MAIGLLGEPAFGGSRPPRQDDESALQRALAQRVSLEWQDMPLGEGLRSISQKWSLAFLLDRRIDPGTKISVSVAGEPAGEFLARLAQAAGGEVSVACSTVYIGPPATAQRLATMAALQREHVTALPPRLRRRWLQAGPGGWEELAEPIEVCRKIANRTGCRIVGLESIPHDLWRAANWQNISRVDELTLTLAQFDLGFRIASDGSSIELGSWPERPQLQRRYRVGHRAAEVAGQWQALAPQATIQAQGEQVLVSASAEDHARFRDALQGRRAATNIAAGRPPTGGQEERFDLRVVKAPAGKLIESIARRLGIGIEWDDNIPAAMLERPIDVTVRQATAEALFEGVIRAAGLDAQPYGDTWRVSLP